VQIKAWRRACGASRRLEKVPGIGPLTTTVLVASVGNAKNFDKGRQFAAWLSAVPRQHSAASEQARRAWQTGGVHVRPVVPS